MIKIARWSVTITDEAGIFFAKRIGKKSASGGGDD